MAADPLNLQQEMVSEPLFNGLEHPGPNNPVKW